MLFQRKMPSFNTVAAGSTSSVTIPKGPTYYGFDIYATIGGVAATAADMKSQISEVRLKVNGVTRWEAWATHIIECLFEYYGKTLANGVLPLMLVDPDYKTIPAMDNMAWGTADVDTLTMEVDLAAGATIDAMSVYATVLGEARPLGTVIEVHRITVAPAATGVFELSDLPRFNGDLRAMHFDLTGAAAATAVELQINQVNVFDTNLTVWNNIVSRSGRTPQTDFIHYEPTYLNRLDDKIVLGRAVQDFRFKLTMSAAGSVPLIMETVNTPLITAA